jgi:hypothetical protein
VNSVTPAMNETRPSALQARMGQRDFSSMQCIGRNALRCIALQHVALQGFVMQVPKNNHLHC